jgi:ABC-type uncharacterized transport system permease subunit
MSLPFGSAGAANIWTWWPAVVAMLAYALAQTSGGSSQRLPNVALTVGWLFQALALVYDIGGVGDAGSGARFGFAPALSATVWLVVGVHEVESRLLPLPAVRRLLAGLGLVVVLLAALFPGEIRPHAGSGWLPLHWLLGIVSYGLFGVAVLHALMLDAAERRMRAKATPLGATGPFGLPLLRLERLTFRFVDAGFVVLSAALLVGAAASLQSPDLWRWDHKTVFSLLGWATFAGLIAGRRLQGWRGRRATRWLYAGAVLLALAYIGSRFVVEVLLPRSGG